MKQLLSLMVLFTLTIGAAKAALNDEFVYRRCLSQGFRYSEQYEEFHNIINEHVPQLLEEQVSLLQNPSTLGLTREQLIEIVRFGQIVDETRNGLSQGIINSEEQASMAIRDAYNRLKESVTPFITEASRIINKTECDLSYSSEFSPYVWLDVPRSQGERLIAQHQVCRNERTGEQLRPSFTRLLFPELEGTNLKIHVCSNIFNPEFGDIRFCSTLHLPTLQITDHTLQAALNSPNALAEFGTQFRDYRPSSIYNDQKYFNQGQTRGFFVRNHIQERSPQCYNRYPTFYDDE